MRAATLAVAVDVVEASGSAAVTVHTNTSPVWLVAAGTVSLGSTFCTPVNGAPPRVHVIVVVTASPSASLGIAAIAQRIGAAATGEVGVLTAGSVGGLLAIVTSADATELVPCSASTFQVSCLVVSPATILLVV